MRRLLLALGLAVLVLLPLTPTASQAREFEIDGTIDCGVPSGKPCLPIGPTIGVITDQISGKRERVDVAIGLILEQRLRKSRVGQLLLNDPLGVNRAILFSQLKPIMEQLEKFDPTELSLEEKERLVDQLFDESLPREIASARDKLIIVAQNFAQDARVRVVVSDQLGPVLVATEVVQYHDYLLSRSRSSGTVNLGQLTGTDSEELFCEDFVEETLDFAKERIQEEGKLVLTDNEELFFDLLADLPVPCTDKDEEIEEVVVNWIRWNLKATLNDLTKKLSDRQRERLEILRRILENPRSRQKFVEFLKETVLKPRPEGRRPLKGLLEERKR